jgi:uncharacterized protein YjiS (DUF1127 family)
MSLLNLFVAARSALTQRRQRQRACDELMALDDRTLADIGIHRSQIPALVDGHGRTAGAVAERDAIVASAFGRGGTRLATGHRWLPPI